MRTKLFMYFCIKKSTGSHGEDCRQFKLICTPSPSLIYATDRPKAVVPVLFLFCVAL